MPFKLEIPGTLEPCAKSAPVAQIAADLDASEHALLAEGGPDSEELLRYLAEGSGNVADNGMFSVQASGPPTRPGPVGFASCFGDGCGSAENSGRVGQYSWTRGASLLGIRNLESGVASFIIASSF